MNSATDRHRIFYLDSMRAILMLLGIVIHSAQIYSPRKVFPIINQETTILMDYLVQVFHLFRMPAFFVVSGYFCYMTLEKYGIKRFLTVRLSRILIPLIATLVTFNLLQYVFLTSQGVINISIKEYVSSGRYIEHLWFLVDLCYFFILTAILHKTLKKVIEFLFIKFKKAYWKPIFLLLPFLTLGVMFLNKLGVDIYFKKWGIFSPYSLLYNYIFFLFGYTMFSKEKFYESIINTNYYFYLSAVGACTMLYNIDSDSSLFIIIKEYSYLLCQWSAVALCFKFFKKFFNKPSDIMRSTSEASYSVYLSHFFILMVASYYLVKLNLNPYIGFCISVLLVATLSLIFHFRIVEKNNYIKFVFNGKFNRASP